MNIQTGMRLLEAAALFGQIAEEAPPKKLVDVGVTEAEMAAVESVIGKIGTALLKAGNGAHELGEVARAWSHRPGAIQLVRAREANTEPVDDGSEAIRWTKHGKAEKASYAASWRGHTLTILRHGPADYEGQIDGRSVVKGKFKKNVRERTEKAAQAIR